MNNQEQLTNQKIYTIDTTRESPKDIRQTPKENRQAPSHISMIDTNRHEKDISIKKRSLQIKPARTFREGPNILNRKSDMGLKVRLNSRSQLKSRNQPTDM